MSRVISPGAPIASTTWRCGAVGANASSGTQSAKTVAVTASLTTAAPVAAIA